MEIRTLEALFSLKFDTRQLQQAIKAMDGFANNVNDTVNGLVEQMPLKVGVKFDSNKAQQAKKDVDAFGSSVKKTLGALAGFFAVHQVSSFFNTTVEGMADVGRTAGFLGISTQALEEMRYAAEKSGVTIDTLDDSLKELQVRAVDAKSGTGEAAEAFLALGMSVTDSGGRMREPLELLSEVADRLNQLPTQSDRIWVADSMLGDQGVQMLKMLEGGSVGLASMRREAKELGVSLDEGALQRAHEFHKTATRLAAMFRTIARKLADAFLRATAVIMQVFDKMHRGFQTLRANTAAVRAIFVALGLALTALAVKASFAFAPMIAATAVLAANSAIAFAPMLITGLALAALFAGLVLIVEDLWAGFAGGESVFFELHKKARAFFEPIEKWLLDLPKQLWDGFVGGLSRAFEWIFERMTALNDLIPDFVKKGFSAAVEYVGGDSSQANKGSSQSHLAPRASAALPPIQNHSNQSVQVSVNVKSGANAHEIGGEVSKAVRKELEKERINAFMGVSQYAF